MEGLLLLLVVGAWLVVLVPMALRSHDTATANRSVDRFSVAMRVLAHQGGGPSPLTRGREWVARDGLPAGDAPVVTPAVRRRRTLLGLLAASFLTLLVGLLGPAWVLGLSLVLWGLTAAFVVHLRRLVLRRGVERVTSPVADPDAGDLASGGTSGALPPALPVPRPAVASSGSLPLAEMARSPQGRVQLLRAHAPVPTGWVDASADEQATDSFVVLRAAGSTAAAPAVAAPAAARAAAPAVAAPTVAAPAVAAPAAAPAAEAAVDRMRPPTVGIEWTPVPVPPPSYAHQPPASPRAVPAAPALTDGSELDGILDQRRAVGDW